VARSGRLPARPVPPVRRLQARPLDPDSVMLAQLTATAEEQRAVADTRELLKRRGDAATIGTPPAKADTRRPKSSSRRKRPGGDESDLVE